MAPPRSISVLMPILNGARHLDRVMGALARQRAAVPWDFLALDCGSTDGTLEIFARHARDFPVPLQVRGIHKEEFNHGCTRNSLAALSRGELLVYLTDDAIPIGEQWLARLAANFEDPRVAAAYSRNITRPEADALVRAQNGGDPTYWTERREARLPEPDVYARMTPDERRLLFNYCDSASSMRRELWERHPYPRCTFGEDVLQARAFLEAGFTVVFDVEATVEHSHDFGAAETHKRARVDGEFHAEWLDRIPVATRKTAERLARRAMRADWRELAGSVSIRRRALVRELLRARELRRAYFLGLHEGALTRRRSGPTRMLASPSVSVLVVIGGGASARVRDQVERLQAALAREGHRLELLDETELVSGSLRESVVTHDVVHYHSPGSSSLPVLARLLDGETPLLVHLHEVREAENDAEVLFACRSAALALAGTRALRARLLAEAGFHPLQLALSPDAESATERARDLDECARELSFRYRALACRAGAPPSISFDRPAQRTDRRIGEVRDAGASSVLLGPGQAGVEYSLHELPAGPIELDLHLGFTGLAASVASGGRIELDGHARARFGPLFAERKGESRILTISLRDGSAVRRLGIQNASSTGARPHLVRLERIVAHHRPAARRRPREILADIGAKLSSAVELPVKVQA